MPVIIGSKYTGRPAMHIDTTTGTYWESLPKIEGDATKIQGCLLNPRRASAPSRYTKILKTILKK